MHLESSLAQGRPPKSDLVERATLNIPSPFLEMVAEMKGVGKQGQTAAGLVVRQALKRA